MVQCCFTASCPETAHGVQDLRRPSKKRLQKCLYISTYMHVHTTHTRGLTCIFFQSTPAQVCAPSCCLYLQAGTIKQLNLQAGHVTPSSILIVSAETFADVALTVWYWKKNKDIFLHDKTIFVIPSIPAVSLNDPKMQDSSQTCFIMLRQNRRKADIPCRNYFKGVSSVLSSDASYCC